MKKQAGFTLIELVMVIVILGILAAFALPRFADLGGQARTSVIQGAAGSIKSASAIVHSAALAAGVTTGNVTLEGQTIAVSFGYPTGLSIASAAQLSSTDYSFSPAATAALFTARANGASTPANCQVTYTAATSATVPPVIATDTTNCN